MGLVSLILIEYFGGFENRCQQYEQVAVDRRAYIINDFINRIEAREEALFVRPAHFVGYAWEAIFRADNAVVRGVEAEFNRLDA